MRYALPALALAFAMGAPDADAACRASSPPGTVALIELYTSQGCSSCPPADRWLSRLARELPPIARTVGRRHADQRRRPWISSAFARSLPE